MNSAAAHRVESSQGRSGSRFPARKAAIAAALFASLILLVTFVLPASAAVNPTYIGSFGPDGTEATEFEALAATAVDQQTGAVYVGDRVTQTLYKFDEDGNQLDFGGFDPDISANRLSGLSFRSSNTTNQVAVDSETHVIYATGLSAVSAFEANGEPHLFTAGSGSGTNELPEADGVAGVAVDSFGYIYVTNNQNPQVRVYEPSGAIVTEFTPRWEEPDPGAPPVVLTPYNLAVAQDGSLYISAAYLGSTGVFEFEPSDYPITPSTTFSYGEPLVLFNGMLGIGAIYGLAVDPETNFVYVGEEVSEPQGYKPRVEVYDEAGGLVGSLGGPGQPGELGEAPMGVAVSGSRERVYVNDFVENPANPKPERVEIFESFTFPVERPTITQTSVTEVTASTATLHAKVNPNTFATTYSFEYGTEDCAAHPGACTSVPAGGAAIGSGHGFVPVSVDLSGLSPDTVYYYRVVATNSEGTRDGALRTFRTQGNALGFAAMDGRVWEQVTPLNKFGGSLINSDSMQAAEDGSGIVFETVGSIVTAPEGNRAVELSTVLARRGASGWTDADLTPPHTEATGAGSREYKLFSPDLGRAVLEPHDLTLLSPEASGRTPYLRINTEPPLYRPLATSKEGVANVPPGTTFSNDFNFERAPIAIGAANDDLTHIVVSSVPPLVPGAKERSLYLWAAGVFEPVSELPAAEGGGVVRAQPGSGTISVHHAVSSDGSRVFWAPGDPQSSSLDWPALYGRDTVRNESFRLDVPQGGSEAGDAHPAFMGASSDGSVVFFTDSQQLTADASADGRDLYRCVVGEVAGGLGCSELEDLSGSLNGPDEPVVVAENSLGMSEDGNTVYFVEEEGADGPRLYVWQKGGATSFIAQLSPDDAADWGNGQNHGGHGAQVAASSSPSGRFLTFMSERDLTGAETADPETGEPVEQAYVYDAAADHLACVSCNPSGATDRGRRVTEVGTGLIVEDPRALWRKSLVGATLPESTEIETTVGFSLYRPRAVLDNGRVFFNSPSALVAADSNGTWDVYQYEPFGVGTCDAAARRPSIAVVGEACVGLVSAGSGDKTSIFLDASASGDDVFFVASDRLSVLDSDSETDVYDARVGGVAAVAEEHPECLGEACQPPPSPPNDPTPASAAFHGAGNPKAAPRKRCARGKHLVHRKGKARCVKRRHGKHHPNRRAGR